MGLSTGDIINLVTLLVTCVTGPLVVLLISKLIERKRHNNTNPTSSALQPYLPADHDMHFELSLPLQGYDITAISDLEEVRFTRRIVARAHVQPTV